MAASFNVDQKQLTLILEPADCTLHYMLYQMKEKSTLFDSISIVQQIADASLYLHECGYIHSNISSHCILVSKVPNFVKLSSFELVTSASNTSRKEIETKYRRNSKRVDENPYDKLLKEQQQQQQHLQNETVANPEADYTSDCLADIDAQLLPYYMDYRRQFSVYNYQAPELLTSKERIVFPTRSCDVYSLTLLLWELLHHTVPYIQFNEKRLKRLYEDNKSESLMLDKNGWRYFEQIFKYGAAVDPTNRSLTVQHLISLLEDFKFDIDKHSSMVHDVTIGGGRRTIDNTVNGEKKDSIYENTNDIINDIDAQVISPMLLNEANRHFMLSPKAKGKSPEKNNAINNRNPPSTNTNAVSNTNNEPIILSPLHNITSSTSYRSVMDFQKLLSPHRNSTMKRRPKQKVSPYCGDSANLNDNISIDGGCEPASIDASLIGPVTVRESQLPSRKTVQNQQNRFMDHMLDEQKENNGSEGHQPIVITVTPKEPLGKALTNVDNTTNIQIQLNGSNKDGKESETNEMLIARRNQLRRNAWLSNEQNVDKFFMPPPPPPPPKPVKQTDDSSQNAIIKISDVNKITLSTSPDTSSVASDETMPMNKKVNVSIKIVHKQLTPEKNDTSARNDISHANLSAMENEESPSVMSRIKFWNSLECPVISPKMPAKTSLSFNHPTRLPELVEVSDRSSGSTTPLPPPIPSPSKHMKLLKEINEISAEISRCMDANPLSKLFKTKPDLFVAKKGPTIEFAYAEKPTAMNDLNNSVQMSPKMVDNLNENVRLEKGIAEEEKELMAQRENVSLVTSKLHERTIDKEVLKDLITAQRRNSVLETVYRIENGLNVNNSPMNTPLKKIENKLFNEKINNIDLNESNNDEIVPVDENEEAPLKKAADEVSALNDKNAMLKSIETDDVREIHGNIVGVRDVENDANNLNNMEPPKFELVECTETHKEIHAPMVDDQGRKGNYANHSKY